jgi:hypothetical protein
MANPMRKIYAERCDKILPIFKRYFQNCHSKIDDLDLALIIATHGGAMGQLEPVINPKQKKELARMITRMQAIADDDQSFSPLRSKLETAINELAPFLDFAELHGKQNYSNYREKIVLIDACRTVWKSYKKKDAPKTFQGETHKFTKFVNDIIDEVFEYDFDARRAIDAFQNRK